MSQITSIAPGKFKITHRNFTIKEKTHMLINDADNNNHLRVTMQGCHTMILMES